MDRRVKYTKKIIKDSLFELLNDKDLKKITVSEICKKADINRATFYRYYLDVYDLGNKIKDEFSSEIIYVIRNTNEDYSVSLFVKKILSTFLDNKELVKILFNEHNNLYSFDDILEITYDMCKNKWMSDIVGLTDEDIEYATLYIFNGSLGIINYWIKNDFKEDIDSISKMIETLSYYGIKRFIYKNRDV